MRGNIGTRRVGLSISAALAIPYTLLVLASVLLVGLLTTGSWQAGLLGIGWRTLVGFEIGLLVLTGICFAAAVALKTVDRLVRSQGLPDSHPNAFSDQSKLALPLWAVRSLAVCFLAPAVLFPVLHAVISVIPASAASGNASANNRSADAQAQPVNMGPMINTAYREAEPSFTADGRTMYFNCNNADICVSHLNGRFPDGKWTRPERLGPSINTEYEEIEPVINAAGDTLYFTSIRPQGFLKNAPFLSPYVDLLEVVNRLATSNLHKTFLGGFGLDDVYVSYRVHGKWSEPRNINSIPGQPHINTPFADHCLFFSRDGNEAFWTSTRPDGFGEDDIWTSRRVDGKWTEPKNLGSNVNGPGSEHTSIPTPDARSLYVTSDRAGGYGGEDIYVTMRSVDGGWGPLVNLGEPINGPGDDRCPAWTPDLTVFLFDSVRNGGRGARDIWWIYSRDVKGFPFPVSAQLGP